MEQERTLRRQGLKSELCNPVVTLITTKSKQRSLVGETGSKERRVEEDKYWLVTVRGKCRTHKRPWEIKSIQQYSSPQKKKKKYKLSTGLKKKEGVS